MNTGLKNVFLKAIPYLLCVTAGITIFLISFDQVKAPNVSNLLDNVAASLLSIPLVFLLYDYTNYRISRQVNRTIANTVLDKTNSLMLNMAALLRSCLGLHGKFHLERFNKLQEWSLKKMTERLKLRPKDLRELRTYRYEIDEILYRSSKGNVLSEEQSQILLGLSREISHLIAESNFRRDRQVAARHIKKIVDGIVSWQESAITLSAHLQDIADQAGTEPFKV